MPKKLTAAEFVRLTPAILKIASRRIRDKLRPKPQQLLPEAQALMIREQMQLALHRSHELRRRHLEEARANREQHFDDIDCGPRRVIDLLESESDCKRRMAEQRYNRRMEDHHVEP